LFFLSDLVLYDSISFYFFLFYPSAGFLKVLQRVFPAILTQHYHFTRFISGMLLVLSCGKESFINVDGMTAVPQLMYFTNFKNALNCLKYHPQNRVIKTLLV
jgi:hypothetical protein